MREVEAAALGRNLNAEEISANKAHPDPRQVFVRRWQVTPGEGQIIRDFIRFGEVLHQAGGFSAGTGVAYLWSSTVANQPIFEYEGHSKKSTIALEVGLNAFIDGKEQYVSYWFRPPEDIKQHIYTTWQSPISVETADDKSNKPVFWELTHEQQMKITPPKGVTPKIRFKIEKYENYADGNRVWEMAQSAVGKKYYQGATKEERDKFFFVPDQQEPIPSCPK